VTREPLCSGTISPFQYGQFIEYLCNLVPGMWAEKLYDTSFEGLSPYKFAFLAQTDFKEKPWVPSGAVNRAEVTLDPTTRVSGNVSQQIHVEGESPCTVGISQEGLAVERGKPCLFRIYLRGQNLRHPVRVFLSHAGKELAACAFQPDGEWKPYSATLNPSETATDATLTIAFEGPGTLWLDNASLMPTDTVGGWRRDVVEALRALHPGIIRFGGSALEGGELGEVEWRDIIGEENQRKPFHAWGGLQPSGAGLEEIVQLCHAVGAEPLLCVRVTGRTAQDAAEEVEYFNGSVDTPMGALRARNGHPEPYRIRYWQVGNELSGTEYEARLLEFCQAMRAADPTIHLLASYPTPGVLQGAGELLDYVCPHQYDCAALAGSRAELEQVRQMIQTHAPGRAIKVGVTEWNTTAGHWGPRRAMLWTLANALACARYQNLLHRYCDLVEIANRSNLTNSFCSGILQTDNHRLYKTPTYYMQQLYATLAGDYPLRLISEPPTDSTPDISATLSAQGDAVILFAVNDALQECACTLDLSAYGSQGQEAEVWTLADRERAGSPDVTNSFDDPEHITAVRTTFHAPDAQFAYRFPPLSLTVLQWNVSDQTGIPVREDD
jgi:alpha-N-arabinofuranosidase